MRAARPTDRAHSSHKDKKSNNLAPSLAFSVSPMHPTRPMPLAWYVVLLVVPG